MFSVIVVFITGLSYASESSLMEQVTLNVKEVCQAPSDSGKYWDVKLEGGGDAKVKLKLADMGVSGQAEFSKGEWQGVQRVLQEQQAYDSANYRECVKKLTPLFLEKFVPIPGKSQSDVTSPSEPTKAYSSPSASKAKAVFENDVLRIEVVSFQELGPYFNLVLKHINKSRQPIRVRCFDHGKDTFLIDNHDIQYYYMTPYKAGRGHELSISDRGSTVELVPNIPRIISFQFARSTESSGGLFTFSSKYGYGFARDLPHNPIYVSIRNIKLDQ